jgi:protein-disulfide isomerase
MLTADGYGIQLGKPTARTSIEIFTEPQCSRCARLQMFQGGEIADYIDSGRLVVTYRPVTSLDGAPTGYSHRVNNALFLAAAPQADLPAVAVQSFVQQLYWDAAPSGDNQYIAGVAATARLPQPLIDRIAAGDPAVDTVAMNAANQTLLTEVRRANSTPTVYDLNAHAVVDTTDNKWLRSLVGDR